MIKKRKEKINILLASQVIIRNAMWQNSFSKLPHDILKENLTNIYIN